MLFMITFRCPSMKSLPGILLHVHSRALSLPHQGSSPPPNLSPRSPTIQRRRLKRDPSQLKLVRLKRPPHQIRQRLERFQQVIPDCLASLRSAGESRRLGLVRGRRDGTKDPTCIVRGRAGQGGSECRRLCGRSGLSERTRASKRRRSSSARCGLPKRARRPERRRSGSWWLRLRLSERTGRGRTKWSGRPERGRTSWRRSRCWLSKGSKSSPRRRRGCPKRTGRRRTACVRER